MKFDSSFRALVIALAATAAACNSRSAETSPDVLRQATELAAQKRYAEAAEAYREAAENAPRDGQLQSKLSEMYSLAGNWKPAADAAMRAADLLPNDVDVQVRAATLIAGQGRFVDVADHMAELLRARPDTPALLVLRGNALARLYYSTWALERLASLIKDKDAFDAAVRTLRSKSTASDDQAAEQALRTAVRLAPEMGEAQQSMANFLWAVGRPDFSEEFLRKAADQNPGVAATNYALATLYQSRNVHLSDVERYLRNATSDMGDVGRDARFALVDFYTAANRLMDARAVLDSMPVSDDASGEASFRIAADDFRQDKPGDAVRRLDAMLARIPHHVSGLVLKARILLAMGNPDLRYARAAVEEDPKSGEARLLLGRAMAKSGDLEDALEQLIEAVRINPGAEGLAVDLAQVSLSLGRPQDALPYARDAVRQRPGEPATVLVLAKALAGTGDYAAAEEALKPLAAGSGISTEGLILLGTIRAARGNSDAARAAFSGALQMDPGSREALAGLIAVELKEHHVGAARQRIDAVVAAHPNDPEYMLIAAPVYLAAGDGATAEAALRRALQSDSASVRAVVMLADYLADQHRADEARTLLNEVLQRHPQSTDLKTSLAILLEKAGQRSDAEAEYERIVAQDSKAAIASYRLAVLYAEQGRNFDQAVNLATAAREHRPDDPAVSDALGWIYTLKKLPAFGLSHLESAVRAAPDNATFRFHLGTAYQRTGVLSKARDEFTRALEIDPNFAGAAEARRALASLKK